MAARDQDAERGRPSAQQVAERTARFVAGLRMLVLGLVIMAAGVTFIWLAGRYSGDAATALIWLAAILLAAGVLVLRGLTAVVPGRAHVVQLFGKYRGTIREPGLQWVNPFTNRIVVSTRIRNQESAQLKVNDADGNPIEIAAVVVWLVQDTAHASYAVDDYRHFVIVQTETAVRHIASRYPYNSRGSDALSLRDNADEITERLSAELTARVRPAPAAGQRGRRRAAAHCRRRRRHGPARPAAARRGRRRRPGRGAKGRDGFQPARGLVQRAGYTAGSEHRIAVPLRAGRDWDETAEADCDD